MSYLFLPIVFILILVDCILIYETLLKKIDLANKRIDSLEQQIKGDKDVRYRH